MKIKSIEFKSVSYCKPIEGVCKQYGVWLNKVGGKNESWPLVYFQKPKWLTEKQFIAIMKRIKLIED